MAAPLHELTPDWVRRENVSCILACIHTFSLCSRLWVWRDEPLKLLSPWLLHSGGLQPGTVCSNKPLLPQVLFTRAATWTRLKQSPEWSLSKMVFIFRALTLKETLRFLQVYKLHLWVLFSRFKGFVHLAKPCKIGVRFESLVYALLLVISFRDRISMELRLAAAQYVA